jgi:transcription elongation factor Elf1
MGRRRKRRRVILKRVVRIPKIFQCPNCSFISLSIIVKKKGDRAQAIISCGNCGLLDDEDFADIPIAYQAVDVYAKFIDLFERGEARVKFVSSTDSSSSE